jgi:hypothetical protein
MWLIVVFMFTSTSLSGDFAIAEGVEYATKASCRTAQAVGAVKMEKAMAELPPEQAQPPVYTACVYKNHMTRIRFKDHTL